MSEQTTEKKRRGFAVLPREHVVRAARLGNARMRAAGKCHVYTTETGQAAGRKGGLASQAKKRAARASS